MERKTIEKILNFLKEKEGHKLPKKWFDSIKLLNLVQELENHIGGIQFKHVGDLDLSYSTIKKLPDDLYVGGYLSLVACKQLTKLPNDLYVEGALDLRGCQYLTELTDNLYVKGSLSLFGTNITELPNNLYVGINLYINNTPLAKNYTDDEIRDIVKLPMDDGIKGQIFR